MAYRIPIFPLAVNVWRNGNPTTNPPDVRTVGNGSLGTRVFSGPDSDISVGIDSMFRYLLLPAGADVRGAFTATGSDTVECPAGSGRYFTCLDSDEIAYGFANWHRQAVLVPQSPFPNPPIVPPTPPIAPAIYRVLGPLVTGDTQPVPAVIGGYFVFAFTSQPAAPSMTLRSANNGLITRQESLPSLAATGATGVMWIFWVPETGTTDVLTIALASPGTLSWFALSSVHTLPDLASRAAYTSSPASTTPATPTTAASEDLCVGLFLLGTAFNPAFPPGYSLISGGVMVQADAAGNTWCVAGAAIALSTVTSWNVVVPFSATGTTTGSIGALSVK